VQVYKTESKYAKAMVPENMLMACGNMQNKVICNAMINSKRYDCSGLVCEMQ
jgi:hypothetical protein